MADPIHRHTSRFATGFDISIALGAGVDVLDVGRAPQGFCTSMLRGRTELMTLAEGPPRVEDLPGAIPMRLLPN